MAYRPETPFQISEDNRLVYTLYYKPFNQWNTERHLSNDVCVSVDARNYSKEVQSEIAKTICDALNKAYPIQESGD